MGAGIKRGVLSVLILLCSLLSENTLGGLSWPTYMVPPFVLGYHRHILYWSTMGTQAVSVVMDTRG